MGRRITTHERITMHTIRISDTFCVVTDEVTGNDQYAYHYADFVGGSVEAYELAEGLCLQLNGKE